MKIIYILLILVCIIVLILIAISLPRRYTERLHNLEAIDDPKVVEGFEKMAKTPPFIWIRKQITSKVKEYEPTGTIVDLGCGSGNLIVQLAKNFPDQSIIGVDISQEMLNAAKKRVEREVPSRGIEFKKGSSQSLPFPDNSVDFLISSLSLHHWLDPLEALNEIFRVLQKGGSLIIFDFRRNSRNFFYNLLSFATKIVVPKALKRINEPLGSLLSSYSENEIKEIFAGSQFQEYEIEPKMAWMFIIAKK
ncbi:MAG: hypothetical protein BAJALOKI1v1_1750008 [Promethearchaeota archaeon]|nr:MAG: hypothetical protein BAJALOKI1v1_1750008 [Candidatus Lokiarchaeota archaeon]